MQISYEMVSNARVTGSVHSLRRVVQGALWHGSRTEKIKDHEYKNFDFLNRENKQVRYSFK